MGVVISVLSALLLLSKHKQKFREQGTIAVQGWQWLTTHVGPVWLGALDGVVLSRSMCLYGSTLYDALTRDFNGWEGTRRTPLLTA